MSKEESSTSAVTAAVQEKKLTVIIGLPGDHFSQAFLLSWTQALVTLINTNRYEIRVAPGKSSFVPFARMQTLGLNTLRGKNQKPFNGEPYDVFVSIDSDVVFSPAHLIELIECTKMHPVVSGYYMMSDAKHFAVVKDWNKEYFVKNGTFPFMEPNDLDTYWQKNREFMAERKKAEEEHRTLPPMPSPDFLNVSYTGLGFFACRKEVLDALQYPYFNRELQRIHTKDGLDLVDMCSEDVAFCKNIQDAGYEIMLHTTLRVGHEKPVIL